MLSLIGLGDDLALGSLRHSLSRHPPFKRDVSETPLTKQSTCKPQALINQLSSSPAKFSLHIFSFQLQVLNPLNLHLSLLNDLNTLSFLFSFSPIHLNIKQEMLRLWALWVLAY